MKNPFSSPLASAQRVSVSAAAILSVAVIGAVPAVVPSVAFAQAPQFIEEEPEDEATEGPQESAEAHVEEKHEGASTDRSATKPQKNTESEVEEPPVPIVGGFSGFRSAGGFSGFRSADGFSGFRSAGDGFQYGQPDSCEQPKNYLWVGTSGGLQKSKQGPAQGYYGVGWIVKVEINPNFRNGKIISVIKTLDDKGQKLDFGDIAVVHDYSKVYGILMRDNMDPNDPTKVFEYEEGTGSRNWAKELTPTATLKDGTTEPVNFSFNSLSVGANRELLFSPYTIGTDKNAGSVYSVDPHDPNGTDASGRLIVKKVTKFPKTSWGTQLSSAGDFIVMPDKSLLGFATDRHDVNKTYVVKWKNEAEDNSKPVYSDKGTIIGIMNKGVWGAARVGNHILAVPADKSDRQTRETNILDVHISDGREEGGESTNITYDEFPVGGFYRWTYGASSSGDTGQLDCEGKLRTRVVFEEQPGMPSGRAREEQDQAMVWSADSGGITLAPKGITTGKVHGKQDVEQEEVVLPGSTHTVHQTLLRNGEAHGIAPFYKTRLVCVDGSGNTLLEKDFDSSTEPIDADVTIPPLVVSAEDHFTRDLEKDTTTCTFYNTPIQRSSSLPMTGARADFWQLFAGVVVLVGFAAFPLWRRRRVA